MIKLGDTVKTKKDTRWYEDLGESVGTVVAISNDKRKTRVIFNKRNFVGKSYHKLHRCTIETDKFEYLEEYYEEEESWFDEVELIEGYKGYVVDYKDLEIAKIKKGNIDLFREVI